MLLQIRQPTGAQKMQHKSDVPCYPSSQGHLNSLHKGLLETLYEHKRSQSLAQYCYHACGKIMGGKIMGETGRG